MQRATQIKDAHAEQRMFAARAVVAAIVMIAATALLVGRLIHLQIIEHEHFASLSLGNSLRIEALAPTRGLIYDRNARVLAENLPAFQLELVPEQVRDLDDTLAKLVAAEFIDTRELDRIHTDIRVKQRFNPVVLRTRLAETDIAEFAIQRPRFPGVDIRARLVRHYPYGDLGVHAVGYVGGLSEPDLAGLAEPENYVATNQFGKTGIEQTFEEDLHGHVGHRQLITNAHGRSLSSIPGEAPVPGAAIHLNLDIELQAIAAEALTERRGAVVAIDPRNGEVLVLVSAPGFDPNAFATGLAPEEFRELQENPNLPLFNRALRGRYPPGSTIKPMLALAALDTHSTTLSHRLFCRGTFSLPGSSHRYRDWKPEGHGLVDLHDAVAQSCDVYFYDLSQSLGIDNIARYLKEFGLGAITGIDIGGEKPGLVPSRQWKIDNFSRPTDQRWYNGETVIATIGQGYMLATPLQLAHIVGAIAMRGERFRPRLLRAIEDPISGARRASVPERLAAVRLSDSLHWGTVVNAMHDVMQGESGTARRVGRNAPYTMAGKSGTAQVFSVAQDQKYDEEELDERLRDHALFIAFAPVEAPSIAVAVIVENGSSGSGAAAPIARSIMDRWLGFGPDGEPLSTDPSGRRAGRSIDHDVGLARTRP